MRVQGGINTECAEMYLTKAKKKNKLVLMRAHPLRTLRQMLLEQYAHAAVPHFCILDDAARQGTTSLGRRALRFFRDYELAHWVRGLNAEAGIAVGSSKVAFQRAQQQNCAVGDSSWKNVTGRSLGITNKQKVWIRKWRKRFSDRYKMMPARDDLAVDELRDKVRQGRDFAGRGLRKNGARGPKKS